MNKILDLTGQKFGRLTARSPIRKNGSIYWLCECDCGGSSESASTSLVQGYSKSCGCLTLDINKSRTKIGNSEIKMSKELLVEFRNLVKSSKSIKQVELIGVIHKKYPQFAEKSLHGYISACSVSDRIFQLYLDDRFSLGMIRALGTCDPPATADFLADEAIERNMSTGQVEEAKSLMRNKKCRSWDEAIKQAMGVVEEREPVPPREKKNAYQTAASKSHSEMPQSFDALVQDILVSGTNWRMKVQMAIDMMPMVANSGEHSFSVLGKLYMLRHALKENLEFVDKNVKEALTVAGAVVSADDLNADITAKENGHEIDRDGNRGIGHEGRRGNAEAVPEGDGQAVPPSGPRVIQGEGRIRS